MDIKAKIFDWRNYIISGGIIIGFLSLIDWLPDEIFLGSYTKYVYYGISILSGYCYWEFYFNKKYGVRPESYQKTVPIHNMKTRTQLNKPPMNIGNKQYSSDVFNAFNRE